MTIAIVEPLEIIDVDDQNRDWLDQRAGEIPCGGKLRVESTPVWDSRQRVLIRELSQLEVAFIVPRCCANGFRQFKLA